MSIDVLDVRRLARLARIAIEEDDIPCILSHLNNTMNFLDKIAEVDVEGVEPMTSVIPVKMKCRSDIVCDGGMAESVLSSAPQVEKNFFLVPKTME
ncbi:MAG: Asp-tRNA(Asn)/Glu-tRNA(Gln) amidotransferase GatCAB subunit C [Candidatus Liberibacter europaeus]|uniref:Aspartyl/glutamyl-tRNA(Asn/Gln) amidotransferase subunit C n=1 Tax=Candidatus Liberibacter europaeus TaxID=744859 RepID=A0A2T4VWA1_9HYPH|nr:Asp-tRNA(Asn)/Glu-tRNA(Gln) amidotransferase GatCAB subunit C [Candidatus Liberibacter europaeus]PTL86055.1 MAG: Asp-tRNA(Asn)/Glu-tRNA(Gln) amidotransferase GatCAB subunit C [Candidatus Liberibacter europaeus]